MGRKQSNAMRERREEETYSCEGVGLGVLAADQETGRVLDQQPLEIR